jgi:uncharacterized protein (DUF305 family)
MLSAMQSPQRSLMAVAAATLFLGGCAHQHDAGHGGADADHHAQHHAEHHGGTAGPASLQMQHHMAGAAQSVPLTGNVDKDFVRMMRMHHQRGLAMAQVELEKGASPEVKAMAQKIVDQQRREIAQFDEWLQRNP